MKRLFTVILLCMTAVATQAFALDQATYGVVAKNATKSIMVEVPDGPATVQVSAVKPSVAIACRFLDRVTHKVLTNSCYVSTKFSLPLPVIVEITNANVEPIEYYVDIHSVISR